MSQPDELPRIGAPATRALTSVGITRLSQLTDTAPRNCSSSTAWDPGRSDPSPGPSRPKGCRSDPTREPSRRPLSAPSPGVGPPL
jgi:hypothetical protein